MAAGGATARPTGIAGLDDALGGGLPAGRVTVLAGGAGSGKTVLGLQSAVNAVARGDGALVVAFEEPVRHLRAYLDGFGWSTEGDGAELRFIDGQVHDVAVAAGEFDLQGLLARLDHLGAGDGVRWIVLDGIDILLDLLEDRRVRRRELFRLRRWVSERDANVILTAKSGQGSELPTSDLALDFLADCVIALRHELFDRTALRALRVVKYRGQAHDADELAFSIGSRGIEVARTTGREIRHEVYTERVGSGIEGLDQMLGGGYFRGSSVLVTGPPGTAKTTLSGAFVEAACAKGRRALLVSFDEAPAQILRNLRSVGIDLARWVDGGRLRVVGLRTRSASPEVHVARIRDLVDEHQPDALVVDPISGLGHVGGRRDAELAAIQLLDLAKGRGLTLVTTSLIEGSNDVTEVTAVGLSTIADTWIQLSYQALGGERNRALQIVKSRGTAHSNQVRELLLGDGGASLADVFTAGGEVLMGTLRYEKEAEQRRAARQRDREFELRRRRTEIELAEARAKMAALEREIEYRRAQLDEIAAVHREHEAAETRLAREVGDLRRRREDGGRDG